MKKIEPYHCPTNKGYGVMPITRAKLIELGITEEQIEAGEARGVCSQYTSADGAPATYMALCCSAEWGDGGMKPGSFTAYGMRILSHTRQLGYDIEGRVSVLGKRVRGFTSGQLFELEDKTLVSVAIIHACLNQPR